MAIHNKTVSIGIIAAVAGLAFLILPGLACGENMINNGGFEKGESYPDGWGWVYWTGRGQFNEGKFTPALDKDEKHGGEQSLRITGEDVEDSGKESCRGAATSNKFTLKPRTEYKLSFWYRTSKEMTLQAKFPPVWILVHGGKVDWGKWGYKQFQGTHEKWAKIEVGINHLADEPEDSMIQLRLYAGGDVWFDDVSLVEVGEANTVEVDGKTYSISRHEEDHPMISLTATDKSKGYVTFRRDNPAGIYPNSYPSKGERIRRLRTFATPGEYEPVDFAIYPLKDLKNVTVEVTELVSEDGKRIGKESVDVRTVKCWIQRVGRGYQVVPELLEKMVPLDLQAKVPQQYWLTFHLPRDASPGKYEGSIKVSVGDGENTEIKLGLRVLPFTLPEEVPYNTGCWVDISAMHPSYPQTRYTWEEVALRFKDMREHGMNSMVYDYPESTWSLDVMRILSSGKKLKLDFSADNKVVDLYKQAGFTGPVVLEQTRLSPFVAYFLGLDFPASYFRNGMGGANTLHLLEEEATPEYVETFKEAIRQIYQNAKENDWPRVILHEVDEPVYQGERAIKAAALQAKWSKEAVPDATVWCVAKSANEEIIRSFAPIDIVTNYVSSEEDYQLTRKMLKEGVYDERWGYIGPGNTETDGYTRARLPAGFKFKKAGLTALFFWGYGHMGQRNGKGEYLAVKNGDWDPYVDIPGKHIAFSYRSPKDASVVPTLAWEGVREGLDDLKYIVTLEGLIEEAKKSDSKKVRREALSAEKMLQGIYKSIPWKVESIDWWKAEALELVPNPVMNKYRWQVAQRIMKLREMLPASTIAEKDTRRLK